MIVINLLEEGLGFKIENICFIFEKRRRKGKVNFQICKQWP